ERSTRARRRARGQRHPAPVRSTRPRAVRHRRAGGCRDDGAAYAAARDAWALERRSRPDARRADAGGAQARPQPFRDRQRRLALAKPATPPDAIVATAAAARAAEQAWERVGRPGVLAYLSDDPDPVAVRLDLRPWGYERLRLVEPGAAGLKPRPDLFPIANPLP